MAFLNLPTAKNLFAGHALSGEGEETSCICLCDWAWLRDRNWCDNMETSRGKKGRRPLVVQWPPGRHRSPFSPFEILAGYVSSRMHQCPARRDHEESGSYSLNAHACRAGFFVWENSPSLWPTWAGVTCTGK